MKFAIITETKNPDALYSYISTLYEFASDFEKIHCFNLIPQDTPHLQKYKTMEDTWYRLMTNQYGRTVEDLIELARKRGFTNIVMGDEMMKDEYHMRGWNLILEKKIAGQGIDVVEKRWHEHW